MFPEEAITTNIIVTDKELASFLLYYLLKTPHKLSLRDKEIFIQVSSSHVNGMLNKEPPSTLGLKLYAFSSEVRTPWNLVILNLET